jgi:transposase-like protein
VAILTPADEHVPDPEVRTDRPKRRTFTAEYKQRILALADSCTPRERGALLRREGLYGSHLVDWRRARDEAVAAGLAPQKRGPKAQVVNPLAARVAELEQSERQLKERLRKAEVVIEIQKKVSQLLGVTPSSPDRSEPFE